MLHLWCSVHAAGLGDPWKSSGGGDEPPPPSYDMITGIGGGADPWGSTAGTTVTATAPPQASTGFDPWGGLGNSVATSAPATNASQPPE